MKNLAIQGSHSLTEGAYFAIREELLTCQIKPGDKLKINELALRLGVNLSAVRESLSRLSSEGLVTQEAQRGFRAAPVSLSDLRDLTRARIEIEKLCLDSALKTGDLAWEGQIVSTFHRLIRTPEFDRTVSDEVVSNAWATAHADFHSALVSACESPWLLKIRAMLYAQSERYRRLSVPLRLSENRDDYLSMQDRDHRLLMEAALARDLESLCSVVAEHFGRTAELVKVFAEDLTDAD